MITATGGAVLAGAALAQDVQLGVAVVVALLLGPLSLINLPLAIVCWLPTVSLIAFATLDVGPNLAAIAIFLAWLGALAASRSRMPALIVQHRVVLTGVAVLVLWVMLSMAWAPNPEVGSYGFFGWIVALGIILVITTTLTDSRHIRLAIGAFILGAVISVAIGLFGGAVQGGSDRIVGGSGDPNFLAAGIVPAMVLAFGLAASTQRAAVRVVMPVVVGLLAIGLLVSGSRGGLIAAIVALVAVFILTKRRRAWIAVLMLLTAGVMGAAVSVDPGAWERISDFSESSGRTELWTVAWQVWEDHPAAGVGFQGFVDHSSAYARELGTLEFSEFLAEQPKVVHNGYLELLAETGIVGLALFLGVVIACMRQAWQATQLFERRGNAQMATVSRSVFAAIIAMLTAAFFISGSVDRRLWVLLALGPALAACAAIRETRPEPAEPALMARLSRTEGHPRSARPPQ